MKYIFCITFFFLSCEENKRYTAEDIEKINIKESNLFGEIPSMQSEPFLVSEAIENKLIDTPIRIVGKIESISDGIIILKEGGKELSVQFFEKRLIKQLISKTVLIEGTLRLNKSEFLFSTKTVLLLD